MDKIRLALKGILPLAVLAFGAFLAKALFDSYEAPLPEPIVVEPALVRTITAELVDRTLVVEAEGTVEPRTESRLISEVSGRVMEVSPSLAPGAFFDNGETLLRIETRVYELTVTRARAAVEQARLRLATEQREAEVARREWAELGTGEPHPFLFREPQIAEARAGIEAAEAALAQAEHDLERTVVVAPFAGRVRAKQIDMGEFAQRGAPVATVYAVDVAEVRLPIPDSELEFCRLPLAYRDGASSADGPAVKLTANFAGREHSWQGRIVRTEGEIDPRTRMVVAIAQVQDPYARSGDSRRPPLAVGMFVRAAIQGIRVRDAIRIPRSALRAGDTVHVVDSAERLRLRKVEVFRSQQQDVLIRGGLEAGERICVTSLEAALDGMPVKIAEPAQAGSEDGSS